MSHPCPQRSRQFLLSTSILPQRTPASLRPLIGNGRRLHARRAVSEHVHRGCSDRGPARGTRIAAPEGMCRPWGEGRLNLPGASSRGSCRRNTPPRRQAQPRGPRSTACPARPPPDRARHPATDYTMHKTSAHRHFRTFGCCRRDRSTRRIWNMFSRWIDRCAQSAGWQRSPGTAANRHNLEPDLRGGQGPRRSRLRRRAAAPRARAGNAGLQACERPSAAIMR
jgi:hypothetical protein